VIHWKPQVLSLSHLRQYDALSGTRTKGNILATLDALILTFQIEVKIIFELCIKHAHRPKGFDLERPEVKQGLRMWTGIQVMGVMIRMFD
jgi:hypothetical protein